MLITTSYFNFLHNSWTYFTWEITFQPRSYFSSSILATDNAQIRNVQLCWEEVIASPSVLDEIKKNLPKAVCAPDFTVQNISCNGAETAVDITALLSRAPTHTLCFRLQSANQRDPFDNVNSVSLAEIEADGRILLTDRDESQAERDYRDILEGRPSNRGNPELPCISFDNHGGYAVGHSSMQLSNVACNSVTLRFDTAAACSGKLMAVHQRQYSVSGATLRNQNVY